MMKMPETLEKMMFGFIESQVLFVCVEIKLFDFLEQNGPSSNEAISETLNFPTAALERLLICAQSMHLLEKVSGNYQVNPQWVPFLTRCGKYYCGDKFTHYWKSSYKLFEHLLPALHENRPQWYKINQTFAAEDTPDSVYSKSIYVNPTSTVEFLNTMWASGYKDSQELCKKFSFTGYNHLVDLGGASGSFTVAALLNNNNLQASIMDYVDVKPFAEEKFSQYSVSDRAQFIIGDMFHDVLPKADIYAIGYVLSDWPQTQCLQLIQKVYDSLPKNGLIVILEKFFNEDKSGPYLTAMLNLIMLLEMYGTHRTVAEYQAWLTQIGFVEPQVVYSSGEKHMLVAKKK